MFSELESEELIERTFEVVVIWGEGEPEIRMLCRVVGRKGLVSRLLWDTLLLVVFGRV